MDLSVIILAAGHGKRMRSRLPKVLQPLAGRPLLQHVIDTARALQPASICVVYGHGGEEVRAAFADPDLDWTLQAEQLGTGHAVQQGLPGLDPDHLALILCGDTPLLRASTLTALLDAGGPDRLALLTADMDDPTGYGRVIRDAWGHVAKIVEERDATDDQRKVHEVNTGVMAAPVGLLNGWLGNLKADNAQGEYYLTDVVAMAVADGLTVAAVRAPVASETLGINDRAQLADAEAVFRARAATTLLEQGVTLADPARVDVRGELVCGQDVVIDVNVVIEGRVTLGDGVHLGPNNVVRDAVIGAGTNIHPNCVIEEAQVGERCEIGPFARMRPGVELAERAKLGNFVELKKSVVGPGSKVNHLTYVGDTIIGANVNVGAGTITCNYDGANKHRTVIGDGAFIGSGVELVAPVEIGAGATIGAGSTITKPAPDDKLTLERAKQVTIEGWQRPVKGPKKR
ncbi:MAG: bifunctional UDP-N-acetylglucosamine diphosphorylase/glucosamine-1-phosphate N-acetyltransferase GlmU [Chromatiales bacterium]|nr:MAG: bifunctional UDP-N-acetylglucosamine diphosphorylase/glucosamine-1-phosphate N-acetyltransferase GlmU [Chromatiales bacterium]